MTIVRPSRQSFCLASLPSISLSRLIALVTALKTLITRAKTIHHAQCRNPFICRGKKKDRLKESIHYNLLVHPQQSLQLIRWCTPSIPPFVHQFLPHLPTKPSQSHGFRISYCFPPPIHPMNGILCYMYPPSRFRVLPDLQHPASLSATPNRSALVLLGDVLFTSQQARTTTAAVQPISVRTER